jgi:hypothetical protein
MKASPLFKASLQQTIERLEGKVEESDAAEMPTGKGVCPNAPVTWSSTCYETCQPALCGGWCVTTWNTCQSPTACLSTCEGQPTCSSTCANTCASTCANTCVGGSCARYRFNGTARWKLNYWIDNNWNNLPNGMIDLYIQWYGAGGQAWVRFPGENRTGLGDFSTYGYYDATVTHTVGASYYTVSADTHVYVSPAHPNEYVYGDQLTQGPPVPIPNWNPNVFDVPLPTY